MSRFILMIILCLNMFMGSAQIKLQLVALYDYSRLSDASKMEHWTPEQQLLEVSRDSAQYFSLKSWKHRELMSFEEGKAKNRRDRQLAWQKAREPNSSFKFVDGFSNMGEYVVVQRQLTDLNQLFVLDRIDSEYFHYSDKAVIEWNIGDETKEILGYKCFIATAHFRGNDWIAWFTPDIPLSLGPWKFGGLPGLILEIYDSDRHYIYEIKGLESGGTFHDVGLIYNRPTKKITLETFLQSSYRYNSIGGAIGLALGSVSSDDDRKALKPKEILE